MEFNSDHVGNHSTTPQWELFYKGDALYTEVHPAVDERALMLLTHGFAEHCGRYAKLIPFFNSLGVTVFCFDLPGHGKSPGKRAAVNVADLNTLHLSARASIRLLRADSGAADLPFFAFGHSMGGLITAGSAVSNPIGVDAVILSSPVLMVGGDQPKWLMSIGALISKVAPNLPIAKLDAGDVSTIDSAVEEYRQDPLIYHGLVPAITAATILANGADVRRTAGKMVVPTLIVHGTEDNLADIAGSREFAKAAKAAHPELELELQEFSGCFHELIHDKKADAVYDAYRDWLNDRLGILGA